MDSVKKDRHKYLGGSEAPIILGLSAYKTRYELLLEKLKIKNEEFEGNQYTEYGNEMEPKIRNHINEEVYHKFYEDCFINEGMKVRCNVDGINFDSILEIKTSTKPNIENLTYLAQLLFYMHFAKKEKGVLAVYENNNFDTEFNEDYLQVKTYTYDELKTILNVDIDKLVANFWTDYYALKDYYEMGIELNESLITDSEIKRISNKIIKLKNELEKPINELKELEQQLLEIMISENTKTYMNFDGYKITMVAPKTTIKIDYDFEKLKQDIDLQPYEIKKEINRSGSIRITQPKNE